MKISYFLLTVSLLVSGASAAFAAQPLKQDLVHVDADLTSDHKDPKSGPTEIINYKLKLRLTNHLKEPTGRLVVRITFHNRDLAKRTNGVEKVLTLDAAIKERGTHEVTSDTVTFTYTPEHGQPVKSRRGTARSKRVPASGKRYAGYSVQVLQGDKIIGEKVSSERFRPESAD